MLFPIKNTCFKIDNVEKDPPYVFFDKKRAKISKFEKSTPMFFIKKQSKLTNLKRVTSMLFYKKNSQNF